MSKETKTTLLDAGLKTFCERGYNNSGIEAILSVAGVPKGSFYYYFGSKEDFGLQVINRFAENYALKLHASLSDESLSPLERLRAHYERAILTMEGDGDRCRMGCLVGTLSQEMAAQSEVFRTRLEEIFETWSCQLAVCLSDAQTLGEIPDHVDVREVAEFFVISWQGAILRAKSMRSTVPLRVFLNSMFGYVLHARVLTRDVLTATDPMPGSSSGLT